MATKRGKKKKTIVDEEESGTPKGNTNTGEEVRHKGSGKPRSRTKSVALNAEMKYVRKKKPDEQAQDKSKMAPAPDDAEATCMMPLQGGADSDPSPNKRETILDPEKDQRKTGGRDPEKMSAAQKKNLMAFVKQYQAIGVKGLLDEFEEIKSYNITPFATKGHTMNPSKNRYKDIFCIDVSRVRLQDGLNGEYIHANVLEGKPFLNKFIGAMGPMNTTINDFWRMVVQENVGYIFMLCSFVELGKDKCAHYYPEVEGETKKYLDFSVTLKEKHEDAHFVNSKFILDAPGKPKRFIYHHYWKNWPDHGVPLTALAALRLLRHARQTNYTTIVHCSAGVGRTGTLMAIEWILQTICTKPPPYDMREMLRAMRDMRAHAVQTAPQYAYVAFAVFRLMAMKDPSKVTHFMKFSHEMAQHTGVKIDGGPMGTGAGGTGQGASAPSAPTAPTAVRRPDRN